MKLTEESDPASESALSERDTTVHEWCDAIMKEFSDTRYYIGAHIVVTKRNTEASAWFIAEVQALYLKHQEVFTYDLSKTLEILDAINLARIIKINNYWAYLIGDIIFSTASLGYFIDRYFDDRLMVLKEKYMLEYGGTHD
jgi:hypothetical protein